MSEVWAPVAGFPGYEVSSEGRLRSKRRILKQSITYSNVKPYYRIRLYDRVNKRMSSNLRVHRLVLEAFRGKPENPREFGAHLNDDGLDNRLENLIWANQSTNEVHKQYAPCLCGEPFDVHDPKTGQRVTAGPDCPGYRPAHQGKSKTRLEN